MRCNDFEQATVIRKQVCCMVCKVQIMLIDVLHRKRGMIKLG